jgi:3-oxoacyl-[acyl-carrier protein] reductase
MKKTFLVTGASKGIGRGISERLARAGHHVVGIARGADPDFPGELILIDLKDSAGSAARFAELAARFSFDGVVNNVGVSPADRFGMLDVSDLERLFRINLHPMIHASQAILPTLLKKGWGRIVNISSVSVLGMADRNAYAASKAAMCSLTRSWALELADKGITVNAVAPGAIITPMFRRSHEPGGHWEQRVTARIPMHRCGRPEEIGATVEFLMSEDAGYITGQTIFVDGGLSAGF